MNTIATTSLGFREGSSDKEYHVTLAEDGDTFAVHVRYGRAGAATSTSTKGSGLTRLAADTLFTKCVNEKTRKGYTIASSAVVAAEGTVGTVDSPLTQAIIQREDTGLRPQLLTPIDRAEAERCLNNPSLGLQRKINGKRVLVKIDPTAATVVASNRTGLAIGISPELTRDLLASGAAATVDGELVDGDLHLFDLLALGEEDWRSQPYRERYQILRGVIDLQPHVLIVPLHVDNKAVHLAALIGLNAEGAVFKDLDAPYTPGRHPTQLKYKFWKTADVVVAAHNVQRSVVIEVLGAGARVPVGNLTVKANQTIPAIGAIVSVKYLYATPSHQLYQPELLLERDDVSLDACTLNQLVYEGVPA